MFNLSSYSKADLTEALKGLKSYRAFDKQIGARGRDLFHRAASGQVAYRAEYFGEEYASIASLVIAGFETHFGLKLSESQIEWKRNDTLKGGVRLFVGDDMVDMSFGEMERRMVA